MGGDNDPYNIVLLTPEEHFVAHQLLIKINPDVKELVFAFRLMSKRSPNNKVYGWLKHRMRSALSEKAKGRQASGETRRRISAAVRSQMTPQRRAQIAMTNTGKRHSEETKLKMSEKRKGMVISRETIEKRLATRLANGGFACSEETKAKISATLKGRKLSLATREKLSAVRKGKAWTKEHREKAIAARKANMTPERIGAIRDKIWTTEYRAAWSEKMRVLKNSKLLGVLS